jgi:hypothetical protein
MQQKYLLFEQFWCWQIKIKNEDAFFTGLRINRMEKCNRHRESNIVLYVLGIVQVVNIQYASVAEKDIHITVYWN